MAITINVRPVDSSDKIESEILSVLRTELNKIMRLAVPAIRTRIQDTCIKMIQDTSEYDSLLSGELLGQLGIPDVNQRLRHILDTIRRGVSVDHQPIHVQGKSLVGGIKIGMIKSDFEDILSLPDSQYISNGRYVIPWLEWLLIEGDRIVVLDYAVTYAINAQQRARSRTGLALMIPGSGFRVDPRYSGTMDDNFITRAFRGTAIRDFVSDIVREELQKRI